jgi:hypothetical protein
MEIPVYMQKLKPKKNLIYKTVIITMCAKQANKRNGACVSDVRNSQGTNVSFSKPIPSVVIEIPAKMQKHNQINQNFFMSKKG